MWGAVSTETANGRICTDGDSESGTCILRGGPDILSSGIVVVATISFPVSPLADPLPSCPVWRSPQGTSSPALG